MARELSTSIFKESSLDEIQFTITTILRAARNLIYLLQSLLFRLQYYSMHSTVNLGMCLNISYIQMLLLDAVPTEAKFWYKLVQLDS